MAVQYIRTSVHLCLVLCGSLHFNPDVNTQEEEFKSFPLLKVAISFTGSRYTQEKEACTHMQVLELPLYFGNT